VAALEAHEWQVMGMGPKDAKDLSDLDEDSLFFWCPHCGLRADILTPELYTSPCAGAGVEH
jgi:hypothetical protein